MKRSAGICILVAGLFSTTLFQGGSAVAAGTSTLTRLRVVLTESSADWASVGIERGKVLTHHVVAQTPGSTFRRGRNLFLKGPDATSATIDLIARIDAGSSPVLVLAKSRLGTARVQVYQTNGTSFLVADLVNTRTDGDATERRVIDRAAVVGQGVPITPVDPRRLLLAFYYPWFGEGKFDKGRWPDKPIGAYQTDDWSDVTTMVTQAAGAKIDGFIVSWDGVGNHAELFDLALAAAEQRPGFYVTPLIELMAFMNADGSFNLDAITSNILSTLQRTSSPAFLVSGKRPVVFVFGAYKLGAEQWRAVAARVAATGINPFFVGEPMSSLYGFDGSYKYNPNGYSSDRLTNRYINSSRALRLPSLVDPAVPQRLWAATVSPGQNNAKEFPRDKEEQPRRDGARYDDTWNAALASSPEWILVTSWNEWSEGTHIQPSEKYGTTALDQTRRWSPDFKGRSF